MTVHVVERQISGDTVNIPEQVARCDEQILHTVELLAVDTRFEWTGSPLSGVGEGEVVAEEGSMVVGHTVGDSAKSWLVLHQDDGYVTYRILRQEGADSDELVVQELKSPDQVQDVGGKYERDQLLDTLQGCQLHRHGVDGLLKL